MASRLFWPSWLVAAAMTGIVAGFMISHAVLLGRFLDWMLRSGRRQVLADTYPVFAQADGRTGLDVFYGLCGLQIVAGLVFLAVAWRARRHRLAGAVAGAAAGLWPAVHYLSGFATVEQTVLRSTAEVLPAIAERFVAWNGPIHLVHAATLGVGLVALLTVPLTASRKRG